MSGQRRTVVIVAMAGAAVEALSVASTASAIWVADEPANRQVGPALDRRRVRRRVGLERALRPSMGLSERPGFHGTWPCHAPPTVSFLDDLRSRLEEHERSLLDPLFDIPEERIDPSRSHVTCTSDALVCEVVAARDLHVPLYFAFSRPSPGRYVFHVGPGVAIATWERMRDERDASERRYEVEGVLRSRVDVERYLLSGGDAVKARYGFSALSYGTGPHEAVYRWRYAPLARLEVASTTYYPWLEPGPS